MELSLKDKIEYVENLIMTIKRNIYQYEMVVEQYTADEVIGMVTKDHAKNMASWKAQLQFNHKEWRYYDNKLSELKAQAILELPVAIA